MHNFFVGNASEFLPGPIYDLNQIGQVVAGMYVIYFFLYLNLFINLIQFILMMYNINSDIIFSKSSSI